MDRETSIFVLVAIAIANGIFSPFLIVLVAVMPAWYPGFLPVSPNMVFYLASLICSTLTLMLSGVAAALFERLTGRRQTDGTAFAVWIAAASFLSLPAAARLL